MIWIKGKFFFISMLFFSFLVGMVSCSTKKVILVNPDAVHLPRSVDPRSYQHGIDILKISSGEYYIIWGTSGNPPTGPDKDWNWTHDIYYAKINKTNLNIYPEIIIESEEAQEPPSSAINSDGNIMITMEDGWDTDFEVCQRYGVYNKNFNPINPYPQLVRDGGHSSHIAAAGDKFVIFASEGWIDGGGVNNLGSGDDVFAVVYDTVGNYLYDVDVAVGSGTRDWWPLVASGKRYSLLIWQRFVENQAYSDLYFAVLDVMTGKLVVKPTQLETEVEYYTYSVEYIPNIDRFLVLGSYHNNEKGFVHLFDGMGVKIDYDKKFLYSIVRESQSIVLEKGNKYARIIQPKQPMGLMELKVSKDKIELVKEIPHTYKWQYSGTDGIFLDDNRVFVVSLSVAGMRRFIIPVGK